MRFRKGEGDLSVHMLGRGVQHCRSQLAHEALRELQVSPLAQKFIIWPGGARDHPPAEQAVVVDAVHQIQASSAVRKPSVTGNPRTVTTCGSRPLALGR